MKKSINITELANTAQLTIINMNNYMGDAIPEVEEVITKEQFFIKHWREALKDEEGLEFVEELEDWIFIHRMEMQEIPHYNTSDLYPWSLDGDNTRVLTTIIDGKILVVDLMLD